LVYLADVIFLVSCSNLRGRFEAQNRVTESGSLPLLLNLAGRTGFELSVSTTYFLGSLYLSLHLLFVK